MKYVKYVLGVLVFVLLVGLIIGGIILVNNSSHEEFTYKDVTILSYGKIDLSDFVKQKISCKETECTYKNKTLTYEISDIEFLGEQEIELKINYDGKDYNKTFKVNIVDDVSPNIVLNKSVIILKVNDKFEPLDYLEQVSDNFDNLTKENVVIDNPVDLKKAGEYEVVYTISDSSNNEESAKLKVIIKEKENVQVSKPAVTTTPKKEVVNNEIKNIIAVPDDSKKPPMVEEPPKEEEKKNEFKWEFEVTGAATLKKTIDDNNNVSNDIVSFEADLNNVVNIKMKLTGGSNYYIEIMALYGMEVITEQEGYLVSDEIEVPIPIQFDGNYEIMFVIKDSETNKTYTEDLKIISIKPNYLKDVLLYSEDKGGYEAIYAYPLGGNLDNQYYDYAITKTTDSRITVPYTEGDILEETSDGLKLKYQKGASYELTFVVMEDDRTITKVLNIKR